jgi:hypothetical protein
MASVQTAVSDMLITVKSREIQRGMTAEMRGDQAVARRHLLAAAHLELVLTDDYERDGDPELAFRSRVSAGSCFWRGGAQDQARKVFEALTTDHPDRVDEIERVVEDLKMH